MTFYVFLNCRTRFLEDWRTRVADWESAKVSDRNSSTSRASLGKLARITSCRPDSDGGKTICDRPLSRCQVGSTSSMWLPISVL